MNIVLIMGSSPDALRAKAWPKSSFSHIVAINNAWRVREDWDYLVYPDDFAQERRPARLSSTQTVVESSDYVPAQNVYGGVVYIGGTMAFTTAYWALQALKPDVLAFVGCDMVYPTNSASHFYGQGTADPLRDDITLQCLEAKSIRLQAYGLKQACYCINLSSLTHSRLNYPVVAEQTFFGGDREALIGTLARQIEGRYCAKKITAAKAQEAALNYRIDGGDYWRYLEVLDGTKLREIDQQWFDVVS